MNTYHVLFNRIYVLFSKGASINPENEKFDGAILSSLIFSSFLFINILTLMLILNLSLKINIKIGMILALAIMVVVITFNLFYFLKNKKYLQISQAMVVLSRSKMTMYSALTWIYALLSIGVFFFLINVSN